MLAAAVASVGLLNLVACNFCEVRELVCAEERLFAAGNVLVTFLLCLLELFLDFAFFDGCVEAAEVFNGKEVFPSNIGD